MTQIVLGSLAIVCAALLWSADGFLRQQLYSLPPTVVVMWEHILGAIVLAPIILPTFAKFKSLTRQQWGSIILVSFLSGVLGTVLYTAALGKIQYIPFSVVVLLQQLQPIFAVVMAAILLKERITKNFLALAAVALVGAYMVSFPQLMVSPSVGSAGAALLAAGAAACWGVSTAFSKYTLQGTSFLHVTAVRFAIVPIFALLMAVVFGQAGSLTAVSGTQWQYLVAITFSTGLVALALYYFGLQRVLASRSTILELAWPLSAALTGYLFLNDRLTATQWIGAVILIFSMILVARQQRAVDSY